MRGEAPIEGTQYRMRFDFNALVALEEEAGRPVAELFASMDKGVSLTVIRQVVWAGLLHHGCTLEEAGDVISDAGLDAIKTAIMTSLRSAMPGAKEARGKPQKTATKKVASIS